MLDFDGASWEPIRSSRRDPIGQPDPSRLVGEGPPAFMAHPLVAGPVPGREEIRAMFVKLFGVEPPASAAEWKARLAAEGRDLPDYAKHLDDEAGPGDAG